MLELATTLDDGSFMLDPAVLELGDVVPALDTTLEDNGFVLDPVMLELEGVLDPAMLELASTDEELEPAFVDDTKLLDATTDDELGALVEEEDEDEDVEGYVPCLIARARSATLGVAVYELVEFFKLQ